MKPEVWNKNLARKIYGEKFYKSKAVEALENYHGLLSGKGDSPAEMFREIEEFARLADEVFKSADEGNFGPFNKIVDLPLKERWEARVVIRPLREALCRGDARFFRDLASAIERRANPGHHAALLVQRLIKQKWRQIIEGKRPKLTYAEIERYLRKQGVNGANVSRILDVYDKIFINNFVIKSTPGRQKKK